MRSVAAIVPYKIYPYNSGGQKSHAQFYHYFSEKKEVTLICTSDNSKPEDDKYKLAPLLGTSVLRYVSPIVFFRVKKFVTDNKIDTVIIEHPYYGWLGFLLRKSCKVRVIIHSHNLEGLRFKTLNRWWWRILWQYEKWVHSIANFSFFIQSNDLEYAVKNFKLERTRAAVITYGITWNTPPSYEKRVAARLAISTTHKLKENDTIIFFNGAFDYKPNRDALENIVYNINAALLSFPDFNYKIIICGRNIPETLKEHSFLNIIMLGFVDDIEIYYRAADIFINPVNDGGGIKTKLVEALGNNITAVSTINGAIGVDPAICNGKLLVVENENWSGFAGAVVKASSIKAVIGKGYYDHFYWENIVGKAINIIEEHA